MAYAYKVWGFGEDIGLRALLEHSAEAGDTAAARFVAGLVRPWCVARTELTNADHVAPGVVMLDLYQQTGDEVYLNAALRVAELHRWFPNVDGVAVHRPDLLELSSLVWVDCVALDAPFLARLARVTGDDEWLELGLATLDAYLNVLRDSTRPLYRHGYDVAAAVAARACGVAATAGPCTVWWTRWRSCPTGTRRGRTWWRPCANRSTISPRCSTPAA